jgi:hypothetical protein
MIPLESSTAVAAADRIDSTSESKNFYPRLCAVERRRGVRQLPCTEKRGGSWKNRTHCRWGKQNRKQDCASARNTAADIMPSSFC